MSIIQEILPDEDSILDTVVLNFSDPDREWRTFTQYGFMPYIFQGASTGTAGEHAREWRAGCLMAFLMARTRAIAKSPKASICKFVGSPGTSAQYWRSALMAYQTVFKDYDELNEARREIRAAWGSAKQGFPGITRTVETVGSLKFIHYDIPQSENVPCPLGNDLDWTEDQKLTHMNMVSTICALSAKPINPLTEDEDLRDARLLANGYFVRWTHNGVGPSNVSSGEGAHDMSPDDLTDEGRTVANAVRDYVGLPLISDKDMGLVLEGYDIFQCLCGLSLLNTLVSREVNGKTIGHGHVEAEWWSKSGKQVRMLKYVPSVELTVNTSPQNSNVAPYVYSEGKISEKQAKAVLSGRLPQLKAALATGEFRRIDAYNNLDGVTNKSAIWTWSPSGTSPYVNLENPTLLSWGYTGGSQTAMERFLLLKGSDKCPSVAGDNSVFMFLAPTNVTPSDSTLNKLDYLWPNYVGSDGNTVKADSYTLARGLFRRLSDMKELLDSIRAEVRLAQAATATGVSPSSSKSSNLLLYIIIIFICILILILVFRRSK